MKTIKYRSATALITVILIVSVVSITAITMQGYLRGEISQTQMLLDSDELYNNLLGIEAWGFSKINEAKNKKINLSKNQISTEFKNNEVSLTGKIISQSRLFNLNYLYSLGNCPGMSESDVQSKLNDKAKTDIMTKIFSRLLVNLNNNQLSLEDAYKITKNIELWMCPQTDSSNNYKINDANLSKWEYQPGAQPFYDVAELQLINNMNNEIYNNIKQHVYAAPLVGELSGMFNVNFLSSDLLAAIAKTDQISAQKHLEEQAQSTPIDKLRALLIFIKNNKAFDASELNQLKTMFTTNIQDTQYYLIQSIAKKNEYTMALETFVEQGKTARIIWRKRGTNDNV